MKNRIVITSCISCAHQSETPINTNELEVFCNHLDLNRIIGYTDWKGLATFPIPDNCPMLKRNRKINEDSL